jgi:hypothetical protein
MMEKFFFYFFKFFTKKQSKTPPKYFNYGLMMRDLAIGDAIHEGVHENGAFKEHEDELNKLYLKMYRMKKLQ